MEKTIQQYFEELPEPYRSQALENMRKFPYKDPDTLVKSQAFALLFGFVWQQTGEERKWMILHDELSSGLPLSITPTDNREDLEASGNKSEAALLASHSSGSSNTIRHLDKWALENIIDAEKEAKEQLDDPKIEGYLLGIVTAFKDVRVKIAELKTDNSREGEEKTAEELAIILGLFERFMPKTVALDDYKFMAMYEAYHRLKQYASQFRTPDNKTN